ncbi:MAG: hypothetical protein ACFFC3_08595 [Candidatus Odinarchaeota archaeon]
MSKKEDFLEKVYEISSELKLPLIDDRLQCIFKYNSNNALAIIKLTFDQDEAIIRGFLGLAEYFHTVIIKHKDNFHMTHDLKLFILESK